jgi:hypothetical protein
MVRRSVSGKVGGEVARLLQSTLEIYPPRTSGSAIAGSQGRAQSLGWYLRTFGYITTIDLVVAMAQQRQHPNHAEPQFVGDILVQQRGVDLHVLTTMLLVQLLDRLLDPDYNAPWRLGEYLILTNRLTPTQLAPALRTQAWLRQQGVHVQLGNLLVQQEVVDQQVVTEALAVLQQPQRMAS